MLMLRTLLLLTLLTSPLLADDLDEEPIPDVPVVEAETDPVARLVGEAASPRIPEEIAQSRFNELVARGGTALPSLARIYRDKSSAEPEVWVAARAMGRIGGDGARNTLVGGLKNERIINRLGAVSALEIMKDKESAKPLERALFDRAMTVRAAAADALAAIGSRKSSVALSEALNIPANFKDGKSLFVRRHIVDALGTIGSIGGLDALVSTLDDEEADMRLAAIHSLQQITGMSFRGGAGPATAVTPDEVQSWKNWWGNRRVGETAN
jgi:hypothetical protein